MLWVFGPCRSWSTGRVLGARGTRVYVSLLFELFVGIIRCGVRDVRSVEVAGMV